MRACTHSPARLSSRPHPTTLAASLMVVLWLGARLVLRGDMSAGDLSAFVLYAVFVGSNAGMLMGVASSVMQVSVDCACDFVGGGVEAQSPPRPRRLLRVTCWPAPTARLVSHTPCHQAMGASERVFELLDRTPRQVCLACS